MTTIWFNNSSLPSLLNCPRQYVYRHVYGLRYIKDPSLQIGSAFHHYMKVVDKGDNLLSLSMFPDKKLPPKLSEAIAEQTQVRLATLALRTHSLLETGQPFVRETFCSFDTSRLLNPAVITLPPDYRIMDALTLDRGEQVTLGMNGPYFLITDYKSTHKPLKSADLHTSYRLASQLRFYATALIYAAQNNLLPPEFKPYAELLSDGRVATRYVYVNYTDKAAEKDSDQIFVCDPHIYGQAELDAFRAQVADRRLLAAFIGTNPHLAQKDGIMSGACFKCPYSSICLLGNPMLEATAVDTWPLGRAPYDPTHQDT